MKYLSVADTAKKWGVWALKFDMVILLDFASYLIYYYTHKKVTHEYNNWRRLDEPVLLPRG